MSALAIARATILATANIAAAWFYFRKPAPEPVAEIIAGPDVRGLSTRDACELVALRTPADILRGLES